VLAPMRFLSEMADSDVSDLEAFARNPARVPDQIRVWLAARGVDVSLSTAHRWLVKFRQALLQQQLDELPPEDEDTETLAEVDGRLQAERINGLTNTARVLGEARMLRDDEVVTPEKHEEIVKRFRELLATIGKSETWAAKSMAMKPGTMSQVLSNTYAGDTETRIRHIDRWIDQRYSMLKAKAPTGFLKLSTALAILGVAKIAAEQEKIAVVYGPSGCGKTMAGRFIASEYAGGLFLEITEGNKRYSALMLELYQALRLPDVKLSVHQMEQRVIETLRGTGRMIVVDEMHALVTGRQKEEQTLNFLRRLNDKTQCPMVWFGTVELNAYLEGGAGIRQGVDQIHGRVCMFLDLATPILQEEEGPGWHTVEDIRQMAAAQQIRLTPCGEEWLQKLATSKGLGGLRAVEMLFLFYLHFGRGKPLSEQLAQDLQFQRLGRAAGKRAEDRVQRRQVRVG
jgi:DNA transposition AAA+ family ATPase